MQLIPVTINKDALSAIRHNAGNDRVKRSPREATKEPGRELPGRRTNSRQLFGVDFQGEDAVLCWWLRLSG